MVRDMPEWSSLRTQKLAGVARESCDVSATENLNRVSNFAHTALENLMFPGWNLIGLELSQGSRCGKEYHGASRDG
jgi:hypothetical protein